MTDFNEQDHPRARDGKFSGKEHAEASGGMDALASSTARHPSSSRWRADTVEEAFGELRGYGARDERPRVGAKESVAAMRSDLKALFGHKFSVRMATGTAYGWARVEWEDGPRSGKVQEVADSFCSERFDGMDDSYHPVNEDAPVRYSLSGVNTQRRIGAKGQAYIDGIFDRAGLTGYTRRNATTGERDDYDGGYNWNDPLPADAVEKVERAMHKPLPGRLTQYGSMTAGNLANAIHAYTDFTGDEPVTDFETR